MLLRDHVITAVMGSTDTERSKTFYSEKLGLSLSADSNENHVMFEGANGTRLMLYKRPVPNKAEHTQVSFTTDHIEDDVKELEAKGVIFEDYDFPGLKTVEHIATTPGIGKSAWFKDPDGNILGIFQNAA